MPNTASNDRPLCVQADERDREDAVRRRLTRERCELVESALEAIGIARGTSYWSVALLVARVSEGWRPLVRSLDELAADSAIETTSDCPASRKRIVRRALNELQLWGLLEYSTSTGSTRRRTRPQSVLTITLDRATIVREATGETENSAANLAPPAEHRDRDKPRTDPGQRGGQTPDNAADKVRTNPGHFDGQTAAPSSYSPLLPKAPSPWDAAAAAMDGFVRLKERTIAEASEAGLTPDDLVALVRQTRSAGLEGGAVLQAVRSGDWRDLVASVATHAPRPPNRTSTAEPDELIRMRVARGYHDRYGERVMLDDPRILPAIARRLIAEDLTDKMTPAEARAASNMNTYTGTVR